jgi:hypothetical protein
VEVETVAVSMAHGECPFSAISFGEGNKGVGVGYRRGKGEEADGAHFHAEQVAGSARSAACSQNPIWQQRLRLVIGDGTPRWAGCPLGPKASWAEMGWCGSMATWPARRKKQKKKC